METETHQSLDQNPQTWRWVRAHDGIIGGVCLGFARQLKVDPWMVRLAWLMAFLFFGTGLFAYILCVLALPRTDRLEQAQEKKILGVCTRLADRGGAEVGIIRLMALVLLCTTFGLALIGYVVLHFVLPPQNQAGFPKSGSLI